MVRTRTAEQVWIKAIPVPAVKDVKSRPGPIKGSVRNITFGGKNFPASPVLDTFYWFMAERHRIHQLRLSGQDPPWSKDELMNSYPFTNVFRVYDRTTQYILMNVIQKGSQDLQEVSFRVILFRLFNKPETWEYLEDHLGTPTLKWCEFDAGAYDRVLALLSEKTAVYGASYICPAPSFGWQRNYSNHLRLIKVMMEDNIPLALKKLHHLKDAHGRICLYPSIGDFIGQQLLLDLNMTSHFQWSENEWAALGPGSSACLRKMFGPDVSKFEQEALRYLCESQMSHFLRLGITRNQIPKLCNARPAGVTVIDIEHMLCECEKYCRGKFPHIKGKRTQVGRPYSLSPDRITAELPEHWTVAQSRPAPPSEPPAVEMVDGEPFYEVSHVVAERSHHSTRYLIRWVGYSPQEDWWLGEADLTEAAEDVLKKWNMTKKRIADRIAQLRPPQP